MDALASLPAKDLQEMKDEDQGAEIVCQFCQTAYHFDKTTWRNSFVTNLNTPFMIGNVEIPNRTVLAPMAV